MKRLENEALFIHHCDDLFQQGQEHQFEFFNLVHPHLSCVERAYVFFTDQAWLQCHCSNHFSVTNFPHYGTYIFKAPPLPSMFDSAVSFDGRSSIYSQSVSLLVFPSKYWAVWTRHLVVDKSMTWLVCCEATESEFGATERILGYGLCLLNMLNILDSKHPSFVTHYLGFLPTQVSNQIIVSTSSQMVHNAHSQTPTSILLSASMETLSWGKTVTSPSCSG